VPDFQHSETVERLLGRSSVRDYEDKEVSEEALHLILRAARQAPTASNLQAYSIIVVRDAAMRGELAAVAGMQSHIARAPVFLAICADLHRLERVCKSVDKPFVKDQLELFLISVIDASLSGMCAALAADSLGLGTVMIGGIRNNPTAAARLLGLPPGVFVLYGVCIGWPKEIPPPKPRLPEEAVVHWERYDSSFPDTLFASYQTDLADFHRSISREGEPWVERVTQKATSASRAGVLRDALAKLGFNLYL
jgi:FMN reductase (NADPH)